MTHLRQQLPFRARAGGALGGDQAISLSGPLIRVSAGPAGLTATALLGRITWSVEWSEVDRVLATRRKIALYVRGGRGARFVFQRRRRQEELLEIEAHGVPVQKVRMIVTAPFWRAGRGGKA